MRKAGPQRVGRVVGYARVSSQEQALGTSLQDQQDAISREAKARGLKVERFFVEAESAVHEKFERREQMQALMGDLRTGDLVMCDKLDRWSRDPEFTYRSMREIREAGANVYFVGERLDPSTSEGDSLLGFRVAFAREEHKRIKLRTVGTRRILRDQGFYVEGLPPVGYRRQLPRGSKGIEKNVLLAVEEDAKIIVQVFKRCVRGESLRPILEWLQTAHPRRRWDKSRINNILRNRVYIGETKDSHGAWIKGKHLPIVDRELFARAQDALDSRRLGGAKSSTISHTSTWLLREIVTCGQCGSRMSAAYGAGYGHVAFYIFYFRCRKKCGARYVPLKVNEEAVAKMAGERLVALRDYLAEAKDMSGKVARDRVDFDANRAALRKKQDRIVEAFTDGVMTRQQMHAGVAKIDAARARIDSAEATHKRASPLADSQVRLEMLRTVEKLRELWDRAPVAQKRPILSQLAKAVRLERDKAPVVVWRTPDELAGEVLYLK